MRWRCRPHAEAHSIEGFEGLRRASVGRGRERPTSSLGRTGEHGGWGESCRSEARAGGINESWEVGAAEKSRAPPLAFTGALPVSAPRRRASLAQAGDLLVAGARARPIAKGQPPRRIRRKGRCGPRGITAHSSLASTQRMCLFYTTYTQWRMSLYAQLMKSCRRSAYRRAASTPPMQRAKAASHDQRSPGVVPQSQLFP